MCSPSALPVASSLAVLRTDPDVAGSAIGTFTLCAQFAPLEANANALELLRKTKRGLERGAGDALTTAERDLVKRDIREPRELGARSSQSYMPRSDFDDAGARGKSQSFSFGRSATSVRGLIEDNPDPLDRAARHSSVSPAPPFGGKIGVAFRSQPKMMPGPGDYTNDAGRGFNAGGFDGTGRLVLSRTRSSPAIKMLGKVPMDRITGRGDVVPDPCAYFPTERFVRPGGEGK